MSNILENLKKRLQVWHEERADRMEAARQNYKDWKEEKLWERRGTTHAFTLF